jgi:phage gpG-like protein
MGGFDFKFGMSWQYGDKKGDFTLIHRRFREGIRNWAPCLELVASEVLEPYVEEAFGTEGSSQGCKWQDLAPSTVQRRGSDHPILHISGALEDSFKAGNANHSQEVTTRKLVWGSKVPYALFHQFGTGSSVNFGRAGARKVIGETKEAREKFKESIAGKKGIPARPMISYSRQLANQITSEFMAYTALIARQTGYAVSGHEIGLLPDMARKIGESLLSGF